MNLIDTIPIDILWNVLFFCIGYVCRPFVLKQKRLLQRLRFTKRYLKFEGYWTESIKNKD